MRTKKKGLLPLSVFVLPSILIVGVFVYGFIGWTVAVSFTKWNFLIPNWSFDGLKNYLSLFINNTRFHDDLINNFTFLPFFVFVTQIIGFFLALLLNNGVKLESLFRTIFLLPMALSLVVTGVIWEWIYNPSNGALAAMFRLFHLPSINWLGSTAFALPAITIVAIWQYTGFTTSIYLAGLRGIPQEILEAAKLDGAHGLKLYWYVLIPILRSSTVTATVLLTQLGLQMFSLVWVMTQGGPAFATDMPAVYMYISTFKNGNIAQGASIAVVIFALTLIVVVPYLFTFGKLEQSEER